MIGMMMNTMTISPTKSATTISCAKIFSTFSIIKCKDLEDYNATAWFGARLRMGNGSQRRILTA